MIRIAPEFLTLRATAPAAADASSYLESNSVS